MSKFYYQDKEYEVPSAEYRDIDIVTVTAAGAAGYSSPCTCAALVKNQHCEGVFCWDCIFSSRNSESTS